MISHAIIDKAVVLLGRKADDPWFPVLVGACAFLVTVTLTLPVELLVAIGVLICPIRWIAIGLFAAIGSSFASAGLYLAFHHLGWNLLIEWYPDIATSKFWTKSTAWLSEYDVIALFALMALPLPIPKMPALAFVAIYRMPIYEVVLAIGLGKLLKYILYAYVVSRFPRQVARWYGAWAPGRALLINMQSQAERSVSVETAEKGWGPSPVDMAALSCLEERSHAQPTDGAPRRVAEADNVSARISESRRDAALVGKSEHLHFDVIKYVRSPGFPSFQFRTVQSPLGAFQVHHRAGTAPADQ